MIGFGPGTLDVKRNDIPSSGWIRSVRTLGSIFTDAAPPKSRYGGDLNWIAISVARRASLFPERKKNGTPDQRQLFTEQRIAA